MATTTRKPKKDAGKALDRPAITPEQLELAKAAILDGAEIPIVDPEVISRGILERIFGAETFEEAFTTQEVPAWGDFKGVPVLVQGFHLNRAAAQYRAEGGSSVYAVVDLERLDGEGAVTVTCGGRNVLAQLVQMLENGWMDKPVKIVGKPTSEGYEALWLEAA